jgi:exodeoxyribonuclease-1
MKTVHANHAPMLAPLATLSAGAAERWSIEPGRVAEHATKAAAAAGAIRERVQEAHQGQDRLAETDPDLMIYSGGFISDSDRRTLERLCQLPPEALSAAQPRFTDPRLPEMVFRYRARNWPETLTPDERETWDAYRLMRLTDPGGGASITIDQYEQRLIELAEANAADPAKLAVLEALSEWGDTLMDAEA